MDMREVVEQMRGELMNITTRQVSYDAYELLSKSEIVLRALAGKEEWSFFVRNMDPITSTSTGKRDYALPEDFGSNFIRGSDDGRAHVCKLNDGSGENSLNYFSPSLFFHTADFAAATNGTPATYTIQTEQGRKRIWLDPPPDANGTTGYTIRGAYRPTFTDLVLDSWIPEEVGSYLLYSVLMKIDPDSASFAEDFDSAKTGLYVTEARERDTRLVHAEGEFPGDVGYTSEFL